MFIFVIFVKALFIFISFKTKMSGKLNINKNSVVSCTLNEEHSNDVDTFVVNQLFVNDLMGNNFVFNYTSLTSVFDLSLFLAKRYRVSFNSFYLSHLSKPLDLKHLLSDYNVLPYETIEMFPRLFGGMPRKQFYKKKVKKEIKKEVKKIVGHRQMRPHRARLSVNRRKMKGRWDSVNSMNLPNFVKEYVAAVINPIHYNGVAHVPDIYSKPTLVQFDECISDMAINIEVVTQAEAGPGTVYGALFYVTYGPTIIKSTIGNAWTIYVVPVNGNGLPIISDTGAGVYNTVYKLATNNYATIWNSAKTLRPVSFGFRVQGLINMPTSSDTQFLSNLYSFQFLWGDFVDWINNYNTDIANYARNNVNDYGRYSNEQGASARFDHTQDVDRIMAFNAEDFLNNGLASGDTSNTNGETFGTEAKYYPAIFVEFQNGVVPDPLSVSRRTHTDPNLAFFHQQYDSLQHHIDRSNLPIVLNYDEVEQKVDTAVYGFNVELPLKFEARFFFETVLKTPTSLKPTTGLSYTDWEKLQFLLANKRIAPFWSDGHSFKSVWKWAQRNVNPEGVRRASNYTSGMIRAVKSGIGDIQQAYSA